MTMATTEEQVERLTRRVSAGDRRRRILFRRVRFLEEERVRDQRRINHLQRGRFASWINHMILRDRVAALENRVTALEHRPQIFEILAGFAVLFVGLAMLIATIALLAGVLGYKPFAQAAQPVVVATVPAPAGSGTAEAGKGNSPTPAVTPPATTAPASGSAVVQRGDTLWNIFVSRLGRLPSWDELIRYSTAHKLPYWTDETGRLIVLIHPGQVLADLPK